MQSDQCFKRLIPEVWPLVAQHSVQQLSISPN